jgi:rare lipoprotein A
MALFIVVPVFRINIRLKFIRLNYIAVAPIALAAASVALFSPQLWAADAAAARQEAVSRPAETAPRLDRSGHERVGEASIYSEKLAGQIMADGTKMDLQDDNAASKTLPLGTKARVTNLETGESTVVTIQDRGPYVKGRIIDLPPGKAREIGLSKKQGVAQVEVVPLEVPMPDGSVKSVR